MEELELIIASAKLMSFTCATAETDKSTKALTLKKVFLISF